MPMLTNIVAYWPLNADLGANSMYAPSASASPSSSLSASSSASQSPSASISPSPGDTLDTNLLHWWELSANGNDSVGVDHMTATGTVSYAAKGAGAPTNMPANVAVINGTGSYFSTADPFDEKAVIEADGASALWTTSVWAKSTRTLADGTYNYVMAYNAAAFLVYAALFTNQGAPSNVALSFFNGSWNGIGPYSLEDQQSSWHLYVAVKDATHYRLYIDGVSVGTPVATTNGIDGTAYFGYFFGWWTGITRMNVSGGGFWDRDLSATEVAALWNGGAGRFYPSWN